MGSYCIRESTAADMSAVSRLLDASIGAGFWNQDELECGQVLVADLDGSVVGVGTASLDVAEPNASGPVGHIRLIAVDTSQRGQGIATTLVRELMTWCQRGGATAYVAYAWVHGRGGTAPLAGALRRMGFQLTGRIERFYGGADSDSCPACFSAPCECPAEVYRRESSWTDN